MVWGYERYSAHREKWNLLLDTLTQWRIKKLSGSETSSKVPIFIADYSYFIIKVPLEGQIFFQVDSFCLLGYTKVSALRGNVSSWTHKGTKGKLSDTLGIFPIYVIPIPRLLIVWGFLCYSNMSVACILRPVGPMGNHFLVCSWMLGEKAEKILWRRKITVYWKFSVEGGVSFSLHLFLVFCGLLGVFVI